MNNFYNGFGYPNYYNIANGMRTFPVFYNSPNVFGQSISRNPGILSKLFGIRNASNVSSLAGGGSLLKNFSFSNILNGASKTLGVINQAIPVYNQIRPMWNNAKTMFRVMKEINSNDNNTPSNNNLSSNSIDKVAENKEETISNKLENYNENAPTFFV